MNIDIRNLVFQLTPPHKRLPLRNAWLGALARPFVDLWDSFESWQDNTRMMVNVNSQKMVLEGYLRKKYERDISIKLEEYDDRLLEVSKNPDEGEESMPEFFPKGDQALKPEISLQGELRERFEDVDLIVHIPADLDENLISTEIERYKQAQVKYKIRKD